MLAKSKCDARVERGPNHSPPGFVHVNATEIVPEPQRYTGEQDTAAAAACVGHRRVAVSASKIGGHKVIPETTTGASRRSRAQELGTVAKISGAPRSARSAYGKSRSGSRRDVHRFRISIPSWPEMIPFAVESFSFSRAK